MRLRIYFVAMRDGPDTWTETVFAEDRLDAMERVELRHDTARAVKAWPAC
jgi:hypothetical protein